VVYIYAGGSVEYHVGMDHPYKANRRLIHDLSKFLLAMFVANGVDPTFSLRICYEVEDKLVLCEEKCDFDTQDLKQTEILKLKQSKLEEEIDYLKGHIDFLQERVKYLEDEDKNEVLEIDDDESRR
jgi:hypothetical protein